MFKSITQYHEALQNGTSTCADAVTHHLALINEHKHLNVFVEVYEQEAHETAARLDLKRKSGLPMGRLHGVVVALKDVLCYKGHKVSAASKSLANFTSLFSATAVQYLIDEEAIIIGNCNCDEFAMGSTNENSVYGPVLNAADNLRVPGGSSGGSAVAVQAGLCMLSLGSDTGGSVRQPASFCGVIGLKPGYGRISRYGLIAFASSFDQVGVFGNSVADVKLALSVISRADPMDSTMSPQTKAAIPPATKSPSPFRIAVFKEMIDHPSLDPEIKNAISLKIKELKDEGLIIEERRFSLIDFIVPAYYILTTAEASSNLSRYDGIRYGHQSALTVKDVNDFYTKNRSEGFGKEVKRRIMLGTFVLSEGYHEAYFTKAQQVRQMLIEEIERLFQDFDAILLPATTSTAFTLGQNIKDPIATYLADIFTVFANLTGTGAISLPLFTHSDGMPFGLQVMTARDNDDILFSLSKYLMNESSVSEA